MLLVTSQLLLIYAIQGLSRLISDWVPVYCVCFLEFIMLHNLPRLLFCVAKFTRVSWWRECFYLSIQSLQSCLAENVVYVPLTWPAPFKQTNCCAKLQTQWSNQRKQIAIGKTSESVQIATFSNVECLPTVFTIYIVTYLEMQNYVNQLERIVKPSDRRPLTRG